MVPMRSLAEQRLLIVAPHPDDEVIGCGGLIAKVKDAGGSVFVQYMTVGDTADLSGDAPSTRHGRLEEIKKVSELLGIDDYDVAFQGGEYHLRLDALPQHDLIRVLERTSPLAIPETRPTMVLAPQHISYNQDHRACADAVVSALRPSAGVYGHQPTAVLLYEELADQWHLGATAMPSVLVGLEPRHLRTKTDALEAYTSQCRPSPDIRSCDALRALAACRGAQSGQPLAEAYHCLRWLV